MQKKTLLVKKCVAAGFCSERVGLDRKLCILIKVQINPHPPIERIQPLYKGHFRAQDGTWPISLPSKHRDPWTIRSFQESIMKNKYLVGGHQIKKLGCWNDKHVESRFLPRLCNSWNVPYQSRREDSRAFCGIFDRKYGSSQLWTHTIWSNLEP